MHHHQFLHWQLIRNQGGDFDIGTTNECRYHEEKRWLLGRSPVDQEQEALCFAVPLPRAMVRKVWLWAGAGALGVLLAFFLIAGFGLMDGLSGGTLWVERMDGDEPTLTLDEARVRREQPELARTLDLAAAEGRATLEGEERARRLVRYLADLAAEQGLSRNTAHVEWQGERLFVAMIVA